MKKLILLLIIFSLFFFINGSLGVAENNSVNDEKRIENYWKAENEKRIKLEREFYIKNLIQDIEFESEVKIPNYIDIKYVEYMYDLSVELDIPARTTFRLVFKESSFIDTVKSSMGAEGLMQLMPKTRATYAEIYNVDTLNLDKNQEDIYIGMNLLKDLYAFWSERGNSDKYSWKLSLASYNAGKGKVLKYKGIPPYKETNDFIEFILKKHSNPTLYTSRINKLKNDNLS